MNLFEIELKLFKKIHLSIFIFSLCLIFVLLSGSYDIGTGLRESELRWVSFC